MHRLRRIVWTFTIAVSLLNSGLYCRAQPSTSDELGPDARQALKALGQKFDGKEFLAQSVPIYEERIRQEKDPELIFKLKWELWRGYCAADRFDDALKITQELIDDTAASDQHKLLAHEARVAILNAQARSARTVKDFEKAKTAALAMADQYAALFQSHGWDTETIQKQKGNLQALQFSPPSTESASQGGPTKDGASPKPEPPHDKLTTSTETHVIDTENPNQVPAVPVIAYDWPLQHPPAVRDQIARWTAEMDGIGAEGAKKVDELVADDSVTSDTQDIELRHEAFNATYIAYLGARERKKAAFVAQKELDYMTRVSDSNPENSEAVPYARSHILVALERLGRVDEKGTLLAQWGMLEFETYLKGTPPDPMQAYSSYTSDLIERAWHLGGEGRSNAKALEASEKIADELQSWETKHEALKRLPEEQSQHMDKKKLREIVRARALENQILTATLKARLGDRAGALRVYVDARKALDGCPSDLCDERWRARLSGRINEGLQSLGVTVDGK